VNQALIHYREVNAIFGASSIKSTIMKEGYLRQRGSKKQLLDDTDGPTLGPE